MSVGPLMECDRHFFNCELWERDLKVNHHVMNPQHFWVMRDVEAGRLFVNDDSAQKKAVIAQFVGTYFVATGMDELAIFWGWGEEISF
jgi:hypothetical protein